MARIVLPRPWVLVLLPLLSVAGCAFGHRSLPIPPEVSDSGVAARILIPPDLNVNAGETVVKPGTPNQAVWGSPVTASLDLQPTTFALPDAVAFALRNSPRLRSARAGIERARGQEQVAFAPFLPQFDVLGQSGVTAATLAPGIPGPTGFLLANAFGTRS
jgi:Outer membrane efflux protein